MKLEVGMYIRINGFISKIGHINTSKKGNTYIQFKQPNELLITMNTKFLDDEKASHNIIDLIEVGDYVNGYKVTMLEDKYYDNVTDSVKKIKDKEKIKIILGNEEQFYGVYAKDIKSIVTKEQFEQMKYKVGE